MSSSAPKASAPQRLVSAGTRVAGLAGSRRAGVERRTRRARARALEARIRLLAAWVGAEVDVEIGGNVAVGRRVRVVIDPGTSSVLRIGQGCEVDDDVRIQLRGGQIEIGPWTQIRRGVLLNAAGDLHIGERGVVSWFTVIHCSNEVRIGRLAAIGEFVTIVDSSHYYVDADTWVADNVEVGSCVVGDNTWIASKATLPSGSRVGSHCIVAAHAVVRDAVPDGHFAAGVPARDIRPLALPWLEPGQPPDISSA